MHAKMQNRICLKRIAQPKIKLRKGMGGRKTCLKQQAHWITFIAKGGLHTDKDIAEMGA